MVCLDVRVARLLVALQVAFDPEKALATFAIVRLAPTVYTLHVFLPMWQLRETGVTFDALERPFPGMPSRVQLQCG